MPDAKKPQLQTTLDPLLLARTFDLETDWSPEVCAEQLADLHEPYRFMKFDLTPRTTAQVDVDGEGYHFDVRLKRRNRGIDYTTVKATGRILYSHGLETTLVRGTIKLGWFFLLMSFGAMAAVLIGLVLGTFIGGVPPYALLLYLAVTGGIGAWLAWMVRHDYSVLTQQIAERLNAVDAASAGSRLRLKDEATQIDDIYDEPLSQTNSAER